MADYTEKMYTHLEFLVREFYASDLEYVVATLLMELGVPSKLSGYRFLKTAILLYDADTVGMVNNGLYAKVARHHGDHISIKLVESAIREAIAAAWNIRIAGVWEQYFPEVRAGVNKRPTNHEFISELSRVLELWTGIRQTHLEKLQRKEAEYAIK